MKASELRIGNLVYNINGEVVEMDYVEWDDGEYVTPIPLTEEWLLRFGFKKFDGNDGLIEEFKRPNNWRYYHSEHNYSFHNNNFFLDSGNGAGWGVQQDIMFVHQLQNLHFALTGQELEINAPPPLQT